MFATTKKITEIKTLFDTGATKSVMSGKMYRELNLGELDTTNLPLVVGVNGSSLGVLGCIRCKIGIRTKTFDQTFLVCKNLKRSVILGKDFARQNCTGVYWTPENTSVLHVNFQVIVETPELLPRTKSAMYVVQHKGRRWPHATPALTVTSNEAIGLLWL